MLNKFKNLIKKLQGYGLPIFLFRDPVKGEPSSTFTFFIISGLQCCYNPDKYLEFFLVCSGVYLGRTVVGNKGTINSDKVE